MTSMSGSTGHIEATTHRFETPGPLEVSVRNQAGSVEITAADVSTATVEIVPNDSKGAELAERTQVQLSGDGSRLRVDVPERKMLRQPSLEIIVTVPLGSSAEVWTATADVECRGQLNNAAVNTASADVSLAQVSGHVQVNTASGDIHLERGDGPIQIRTASGDVRLDVSSTDAEVKTASGDLMIGRIAGDLSARSASGDVIVKLASAGSLEAKTMSGDVIIGVASGLLLWLDLNSLSGDVASQLSSADRVSPGAADDPDGEQGPDLRITASSMSGDIVLRRGH